MTKNGREVARIVEEPEEEENWHFLSSLKILKSLSKIKKQITLKTSHFSTLILSTKWLRVISSKGQISLLVLNWSH